MHKLQAVSLFLIGLVIAARTYTYHVTGITVVVGIAVAAALLFTVAVIGLIGTLKHNQVALFFVSKPMNRCSLKYSSTNRVSGFSFFLS